MFYLYSQPPADVPDEPPEDAGHDGDPQPRARHQEYLHQLPPPLEVLAHHQCGRVPGHAHAHPQDEAVAEEELVVLQSEGGEEAGQTGDEAAHDGGQADGLPPAVGHRQRRHQEGHRHGQAAQQP